MVTIPIQLPHRSYDVVIGEQVLSELGPRVADLRAFNGQAPMGKRAFLVVDDGLPAELIDEAVASLAASGLTPTIARITATEANKTLDTASRLLHEIAKTRHERTDPVIALGGGIVGDIAGFVGATFKRGVPVVQCPTTLLAMVDASVGGKTGVNLLVRSPGNPPTLAKNLVGSFWQPSLVIADVAALESLPERHLRAGLAECLKHGLISADLPDPSANDPELFAWTSTEAIKVRLGDSALREELVARNVRIKAAVVAHDEREEAPSHAGGRALLNLGHTFAHAIETLERLSPDGSPDHAPLLHGEAVAYGLVAAAGAAQHLGLLSADDAVAVRVGVERLGLVSRLIGLPGDEELIARMMHDKKVASGKLRLVLPTAIGRCRVVEDPPMDAVRAGLGAIRAVARR